MNEVPVDFAFKESVSLESLESGMRAVESNKKITMALLAVALGRIKREKLYLSAAQNFKEYLELERTDLSYRKDIYLATVGGKF